MLGQISTLLWPLALFAAALLGVRFAERQANAERAESKARREAASVNDLHAVRLAEIVAVVKELESRVKTDSSFRALSPGQRK